jgi:hypothetical protein
LSIPNEAYRRISLEKTIITTNKKKRKNPSYYDKKKIPGTEEHSSLIKR